MKGAVEVDVVDAGRRAIELEVPPARIGFRSVRHVAERHEQPAHVRLIGLDERGQRERTVLQGEGQRPDAAHLPELAG